MTRCVFVCCTSSHSVQFFIHKRLSIIGFYAQLDLVCEFYCGFVTLCSISGDVVLADQGFTYSRCKI